MQSYEVFSVISRLDTMFVTYIIKCLIIFNAINFSLPIFTLNSISSTFEKYYHFGV